MFEKKSVIISENQDDKAYFLTNFIIFHSENINSEDDDNVEKIKNK